MVMPFLTVDAIIGNQAFQNGRCYICFSLDLDKVETGYLLMELKCTHQMLDRSFSYWFACGWLLFVVWGNSIINHYETDNCLAVMARIERRKDTKLIKGSQTSRKTAKRR